MTENDDASVRPEILGGSIWRNKLTGEKVTVVMGTNTSSQKYFAFPGTPLEISFDHEDGRHAGLIAVAAFVLEYEPLV